MAHGDIRFEQKQLQFYICNFLLPYEQFPKLTESPLLDLLS